jgi:WD40 repeat protein
MALVSSSLMVCGAATGAVGVFRFEQTEQSWQLRAAFSDQVSAVTCCDICYLPSGGGGTVNEAQVWVASGGGDGRVFVYAVPQSAVAAASGVIDSSTNIRGAYRHIRRVNDVRLCATSSGSDSGSSLLLASASDDWSVQIWDCLRQTHVFNYRKHAGSVRCLAWAWERLDRSVLFSGSEVRFCSPWRACVCVVTLILLLYVAPFTRRTKACTNGRWRVCSRTRQLR